MNQLVLGWLIDWLVNLPAYRSHVTGSSLSVLETGHGARRMPDMAMMTSGSCGSFSCTKTRRTLNQHNPVNHLVNWLWRIRNSMVSAHRGGQWASTRISGTAQQRTPSKANLDTWGSPDRRILWWLLVRVVASICVFMIPAHLYMRQHVIRI